MERNPHLTEREQREKEEIARIFAAAEHRSPEPRRVPEDRDGERAPHGRTIPRLL